MTDEPTTHEALVFDLDGTLASLDVDWDAVAGAVAATLRERDVDPPESLWEMLEAADRAGCREAVESVIASHEVDGAKTGQRLPAATVVGDLDVPVGVCTLNCEAAAHTALEVHGVTAVDAVVGRDTVATEKPHPEPLLETIRRVDGDPETALFVGDSERDERTAERAGTDFSYVSAWLRSYR